MDSWGDREQRPSSGTCTTGSQGSEGRMQKPSVPWPASRSQRDAIRREASRSAARQPLVELAARWVSVTLGQGVSRSVWGRLRWRRLAPCRWPWWWMPWSTGGRLVSPVALLSVPLLIGQIPILTTVAGMPLQPPTTPSSPGEPRDSSCPAVPPVADARPPPPAAPPRRGGPGASSPPPAPPPDPPALPPAPPAAPTVACPRLSPVLRQLLVSPDPSAFAAQHGFTYADGRV